MDQVPSPPLPGSFTVSPLFQWETVALVVGLAVVVALVAAVLLVAGLGRARRPEWEDWLASRSAAPEDPDRT
ncbi:hypothetical protein DQ244_12440 [Blastococcus sp. TBT05-19]|uniref:hypothetical protein n=1 Tax=Blastococcus sp. TBT05-19 TaxID=2250581 RepID=UPI000DEB1E35|nr:hypothetical protein [Blastococcus sp. TBT05-19]RBY90266.1 hypothetical protein DQ244_12440 [Blastococcus sp. TBT05-19]